MPKQAKKLSVRLAEFVALFPCLKTDGKALFCKACSKPISSEKLFCVKQHIKSASHMANAKKMEEQSTQQQFLQESLGVSKVEIFNTELCEAFAAADIPFYKLNNLVLKSFFDKYMPYKVHSERTLRKSIHSLYYSALEKIRIAARNEYLWISIDETTDSSKRSIANVVVGLLSCDTNEKQKTFLLNVVELDKVNHSSIARLFDDSVNLLGAEFKNNILLFLSDAAPYMVKAGEGIRVFYPKVIHVTCLAHGLHRVCETIRSFYSLADKLVADVKKIFLKAPDRVQIFKDMCDLPLPPQPVITRWGTWIEAVSYYAANYETIKNIVNALDCEDAQCIKSAQDLFKNSEVKQQIVFINVNYGYMSKYIKKLEASGLSLKNAIQIVDEAKLQVASANNNTIIQKFESVLLKNKGFQMLKNITKCFRENTATTHDSNYTVSELSSLKFAPITSVDTERTFSMYKNFFRDNRHSFTFDNMAEYFLIYCNNNMS